MAEGVESRVFISRAPGFASQPSSLYCRWATVLPIIFVRVRSSTPLPRRNGHVRYGQEDYLGRKQIENRPGRWPRFLPC